MILTRLGGEGDAGAVRDKGGPYMAPNMPRRELA
jgi:hypothetical protein